ncbi:hypothetical protein FB451DRAFT_1361328 [Mycena latifolia]|nr:hypothetical protein FB451DRAFT_1361328 [Mycena latifolia]
MTCSRPRGGGGDGLPLKKSRNHGLGHVLDPEKVERSPSEVKLINGLVQATRHTRASRPSPGAPEIRVNNFPVAVYTLALVLLRVSVNHIRSGRPSPAKTRMSGEDDGDNVITVADHCFPWLKGPRDRGELKDPVTPGKRRQAFGRDKRLEQLFKPGSDLANISEAGPPNPTSASSKPPNFGAERVKQDDNSSLHPFIVVVAATNARPYLSVNPAHSPQARPTLNPAPQVPPLSWSRITATTTSSLAPNHRPLAFTFFFRGPPQVCSTLPANTPLVEQGWMSSHWVNFLSSWYPCARGSLCPAMEVETKHYWRKLLTPTPQSNDSVYRDVQLNLCSQADLLLDLRCSVDNPNLSLNLSLDISRSCRYYLPIMKRSE